MTPDHIEDSVPVPLVQRATWHRNTFSTFMGIFLWVGSYLRLAVPTLSCAGIGVFLWEMLVAGILCFALTYYFPASLGITNQARSM